MRITKRNLLKIIREEKRRLREDSIDDELDNLHKNIGDDLEHIRDLKDDIKDDHEEELHAEEERRERAEERHDESFRRRNIRRSVRRIMREERDADWGMGSHEQSRTHSGEDYTGHAGDDSKTHAGKDYEGDDVEGKAMDAMKAIHDLASAAGVELHADVSGPSDLEAEGLAVESRRRYKGASKRNIRRIVRENTRPRRRVRRSRR